MQTFDPAEINQAMVVAEIDAIDPHDKFKLSLQEKFAVHRAVHAGGIDGADPEFYMAVAKSRRRLVVFVENDGERILADIEKLHESARQLGSLEAAFRQAFSQLCAGHQPRGPFICDFSRAHWAEGPMD